MIELFFTCLTLLALLMCISNISPGESNIYIIKCLICTTRKERRKYFRPIRSWDYPTRYLVCTYCNKEVNRSLYGEMIIEKDMSSPIHFKCIPSYVRARRLPRFLSLSYVTKIPVSALFIPKMPLWTRKTR